MEIKILAHVFLILCGAAVFADGGSLAPWTSPKAKGSAISCWGRTYEFGSSLLPSSIITQGDDILAGPIAIEARVAGTELGWRDSAFQVVSSDDEKISYETKLSADSLSASCRMITEFDGTTRVDLTITPQKAVKLDSLDIIIPLKPRYVTLFHHSPTYPIHVWDWPTRRINAGEMKPDGLKLPYVFHLWLGDDDRGLQIFSESDEVWSPADPENCITVTPGKDAAILRMNILSDYELLKPWKWTFGFIATPVKPWPDDYYSVHYCQMGGVRNVTHSWGGKPVDADHPPYIDILKKQRVNYLGCHEEWSDEQSLPRPKDPSLFKAFTKAAHERGMAVTTYTGCYMSTRSPEYRKEWDCFPIGDHWQYKRSDNGDICRIVCNNTPYVELLIDQYTKAMPKLGIDAIYMDGLSCPLPCINTEHGCGYIGKDGQVRPTMPIWRTRKLMKDFWRLVKKNERGIVMSHMSSSVLLPALSFADIYLDGEHLLNHIKVGAPEYPEDNMRAEMSGHNFGIPCTQLPTRSDDPVIRERGRTLCLLHDSLWMWSPESQKDIWLAYDSFGMKGVQWLPYWKTAGLIASSDRDSIRVSAYLDKGRGALFVIANMGENELSPVLTIKRKGLEIESDNVLIARDETSGENLQLDGDSFRISLKPGTFGLIAITREMD